MPPLSAAMLPPSNLPPVYPPPSPPTARSSGVPGPTPTADHPQYHPPAFLEPAPLPSPNPLHPTLAGTRSREFARLAPDLSRQSWRSCFTDEANKILGHTAFEPSSVGTASRPTGVQNGFSLGSISAPSSAQVRVAQLEAEVARLEARLQEATSGGPDFPPPLSGLDLPGLGRSAAAQPAWSDETRTSSLDRLRVELQFQRNLADRESFRRQADNEVSLAGSKVSAGWLSRQANPFASATALMTTLTLASITWNFSKCEGVDLEMPLHFALPRSTETFSPPKGIKLRFCESGDVVACDGEYMFA
ncbi:unnamed protein product [Protopolystoma xenopodis]|uniref:Uncharacterized protein n=1 Tax=Protopolystoma xenopodis TaxID=117903 RepID=A0A3S5AB97_9PLAT|nr:unnamed protein product [Protopolystoma xenopodis]